MDIVQKTTDINVSPDALSVLNGKRVAEYTTMEKDEVLVTFIHQYGPAHPLTGTKGLAYYTKRSYNAMQAKHGKALYPMPIKFTW